MISTQPDPAIILRALAINDASAIVPVTGGTDTLIWRVERASTTSVLRLFRPEQARACRREAALLRALSQRSLPIPRLEAEGVWQERPALLLSWAPGETIADHLRSHPGHLWPLAVAFGRYQAVLHTIVLPEDQHDRTAAWINRIGPGDSELRHRLGALSQRYDAPVHFDYHPLNVVVEGLQITGILDWTNGAAGDPRADFARTAALCQLMRRAPGLPRLASRLVGEIFERGWRHGYGPIRGAADLSLYYAWAGSYTLRDLTAKARPGVSWPRASDLAPLRRWTAHWRRRAWLPEAGWEPQHQPPDE